jgi:hypothetical protein
MKRLDFRTTEKKQIDILHHFKSWMLKWKDMAGNSNLTGNFVIGVQR